MRAYRIALRGKYKHLSVLVDKEDYEKYKDVPLYYSLIKKTQTGYVARKMTVYLHREIANAPSAARVDHKDGDTLNCCRSNLRAATHSQNMANSRARTKRLTRKFTNPYRGVYFYSNPKYPQYVPPKPWQAVLSSHRKRVYLGYYLTPEAAARAWDKAAFEKHGEFARLNFPL